MKARPDLTPESMVVKSNPNNFYVDENGKVSEIESPEDCVLFGTVATPRQLHNNSSRVSADKKEG